MVRHYVFAVKAVNSSRIVHDVRYVSLDSPVVLARKKADPDCLVRHNGRLLFDQDECHSRVSPLLVREEDHGVEDLLQCERKDGELEGVRKKDLTASCREDLHVRVQVVFSQLLAAQPH